MVGQWTVTKPSRSDEVLDVDEQQRIADQIRVQLDSLSPKRPLKPNRSEPDAPTSIPLPSTLFAHNIPELHKFQTLQSQSNAILSAERYRDVQDEVVETQYYKELNSIDKQHHTTGSGFIKVEKEGGGCDIQFLGSHVDAGEANFTGYRSNPATNDWVPTIDEH